MLPNLLPKSLAGKDGYVTITLTKAELDVLRSIIREQWLKRISDIAPGSVEAFKAISMDRYHELDKLINHSSAWPKINRILPPLAVTKIRELPVFEVLTNQFGDFTISDEENLGRENIYWRLVRPNSHSDVGPMHADQWFWNLGHGRTPVGVHRVKIWIAIYCESGKSGFRFVPGSHRKDWPYHGVFKDGLMKPVIDVKDQDLDIQMFNSQPGDAIVFHDKLLHGGAVGGSLSRVSLEFTMFVKDDNQLK